MSKPENCFSAPELATLTCRWLDDKFNGDVLPLANGNYLSFFQHVHQQDKRVLHELSNIMLRAPGGVLSFDLFWNGIDFAHVPVGLLSEVYEDYAHRFFKNDAKKESVRFTPRQIAEFTVSQAFEGLQTNTRHRAKLLDPAAGAGVFLVLGLQRLIAENWRASGERPDTKKIRDILDKQIRGFDINTSALTLAALSLYLTALELDPAPYPPEKLRFNKLLGHVLFNMRAEHEAYPYGDPVLGSLAPAKAHEEHLGTFDVVVGNPPWTAWSGEAGRMLTEHVNVMVRGIVSARASNEALKRIARTYAHNDMVPDIAFVWRSAQWAKEDGIIALIVHARILFKRTEKGASMREALLRSFHITGILNGAELIKLWPHLNQPFCILFARNRVSKPGDMFHYVTPELERAPDGGFQMRIDSESAHPIQLEAITTQPFLLKSLFRGGRLDVELMKRLNELSAPQVLDDDEEEQLTALASHQTSARVIRFRELFSKESGLFGGQGYMPGTGQKATELLEMNGKRLTKHDAVGLFISASRLQPFTDPQVHRRRDSRIYRPPLVLISEGFFESTASIRSRLYLGRMPLIFNRSFYGYSTLGHPKAEDLAKYLFILASSDLFAYYILQSSAKAGVERRTVLEEDVGDFPVVAFSSLDKRHIKRMREIVKELSAEEADSSWRLLNDWVYELYSLTANDKQVIKDTLDTRMPFDAAIRKALRPATGKEKREFVGAVTTILTPFFKSTGETIQGTLVDSGIDTWVVFDVHTGALNASSTDAITKIALLIADQETSTRVMQEMGRGRLRVAIRNQYRYLTKTRARLCAIDILRDKSHLFPVGK
jgi:type I restriction-modification system DNA methylase subunit